MPWYDHLGKNEKWLLAALNVHGIPYLIHGGSAMAYYGMRKDAPPSDLDLFVPFSEKLLPAFNMLSSKAAAATGHAIAPKIDPYLYKPGSAFALKKDVFKADFLVMEEALFRRYYSRKTITQIGFHEVSIIAAVDEARQKSKSVERYQRKLARAVEDLEGLQKLLNAEKQAESGSD